MCYRAVIRAELCLSLAIRLHQFVTELLPLNLFLAHPAS